MTEALDKRFLDVLRDYRNDEGEEVGSFAGLLLALVPALARLDVEYAFEDTLAIRLHGSTPRYNGCNVRGLITREGWRRLRREAVPGLTFRDREEGRGDVGHDGYGGSLRLCDSLEGMTESIYGVRVVTLAWLIGGLLEGRSRASREEAELLIRANRLDRSWKERLPEDRRASFCRIVQKVNGA